jgi:hypothetical protein
MKTYILMYINDRPYSVPLEFWFRPSITELKECYADFMKGSYEILQCELGKEAEYLSDSFKRIRKDLPMFEGTPDNVTYCDDCMIFYEHQDTCGRCGASCKSTDV